MLLHCQCRLHNLSARMEEGGFWGLGMRLRPPPP